VPWFAYRSYQLLIFVLTIVAYFHSFGNIYLTFWCFVNIIAKELSTLETHERNLMYGSKLKCHYIFFLQSPYLLICWLIITLETHERNLMYGSKLKCHYIFFLQSPYLLICWLIIINFVARFKFHGFVRQGAHHNLVWYMHVPRQLNKIGGRTYFSRSTWEPGSVSRFIPMTIAHGHIIRLRRTRYVCTCYF
jgi:hypothetical protein